MPYLETSEENSTELTYTQAELAEIGETMLNMGIIPDKPFLDAMGVDEATARGIQAVTWLSRENDPEAQQTMEMMIDLAEGSSKPLLQQDADSVRAPVSVNAYALNGFDGANHSTGFGMVDEESDADGVQAMGAEGKPAESNTTPDYYVGPNGKVLPSQYKDWIGTNKQQELLQKAQNPKLRNAITELYRGVSFIDDGGTAGVIRFERSTGLMLGKNGKPHTKKGEEMLRYLENKILSQDLSPSDLALAIQLRDDLKEALERW